MAGQPNNTFDKYDAVGIREALSDVIYNISPEDTPFLSNVGREHVKNTTFEWQTDSLAAASTTNYVIEGDDVTTFDAVTPTNRLNNYTQISRKTLVVSGTLEATDRAGRASELTYQMSMRSKEIKRDMETMALANNAKVAGSSSVARETGSLLSFIHTNTEKKTGGSPSGADPTGDGTNVRADNSATQLWSETLLKSVAQKVWASGGDLKMLLVGGDLKVLSSSFTGIAAQQYSAPSGKPTTIMGAAEVYLSDFGTLSIVPDRFMRARDALFIDPAYVSFAYLRDFSTIKLAKTGDNEKRMLIVEWGLKVKNEAALGGAFDLKAV